MAPCEVKGYGGENAHLIPNTKMQAVLYDNATFHGVTRARGLTEKPEQRLPRRRKSTREDKLPVGASLEVFATLRDEGLMYLGLHRTNKIDGVGSDDFPMLTMIYMNDVRKNFESCVNALLQNVEIRAAYGIDVNTNPEALWKVRTPEAASGMTVGLAQLVLMPRTMDFQDLFGNMRGDGRSNVGLTRARLFLSVHISNGCLQADDTPSQLGEPGTIFANASFQCPSHTCKCEEVA